MVSHSGQEGRLQVLEVSSRAGLSWRGSGVPGQGHVGLQDSRAWVCSLWKEEARCKAQQKPESSWLSSGGVTLPGKNSSKVEQGLLGSWCQDLEGCWQLPLLEITVPSSPCPPSILVPCRRTTPQPPRLFWAGFPSASSTFSQGTSLQARLSLLSPRGLPGLIQIPSPQLHQERLWAQ